MPAIRTSLALPDRIVFKVLLVPIVTLPDFITRASREEILLSLYQYQVSTWLDYSLHTYHHFSSFLPFLKRIAWFFFGEGFYQQRFWANEKKDIRPK